MTSAPVPDNTNPTKPRRDLGIPTAVLIAIVILAAAVAPLILAMLRSGRYHTFVSDLTASVNSSRQTGQVIVEYEGETSYVPIANISEIYLKLMNAGMGKEQKRRPDGPSLIIRFTDGAELSFQETSIPETTAVRETGLFVRFANQKGAVYQYDTDQLTLDRILRSLYP